MSYIKKAITRNEKLLMITRLHWIYPLQGLIGFALLATLGLVIDHNLYVFFTHNAIAFKVDLIWIVFTEKFTPIPWLFAATGMAVLLPQLISYISVEIGLTDQRIIYKKGLIFIEIDQFDLEDIRAENVIHGWFGWLFKYGRVHLDCRFVDDVYLPAIANPYRLVKASHTARMKHPGIAYTKDEFERNIEEIEKRRQQAQLKIKLQALKQGVKGGFRKAAND